MNTVFAETISEQLLDLPVFAREAGRLRVHSVFAHGFNLAAVPEAWTGEDPGAVGGPAYGQEKGAVGGPVYGQAKDAVCGPEPGAPDESEWRQARGAASGLARERAFDREMKEVHDKDRDTALSLAKSVPRLIFVGDGHGELAPCGIRIAQDGLDRLSVAPGVCVIWRRAEMSLIAGGFGICLTGADRVSNASKSSISCLEREAILRSAEKLGRRVRDELTGFGVTVGEAASPGRQENRALASCFRMNPAGSERGSHGSARGGKEDPLKRRSAVRGGAPCHGSVRGGGDDPAAGSGTGRCGGDDSAAGSGTGRCGGEQSASGEIRQILRRWVGAGPGLTPSGDDFLAGVLMADRLHPILGNEWKSVLRGMLKEAVTTDVSCHYLSCALSGLFSESWLRLTEGLLAEDESAVADGYGRILDFGHTSGRDMIAGFLFGIQRWEKQ